MHEDFGGAAVDGGADGIAELRRGLNRLQRMLGSRRIQSRLVEATGVDLTQQSLQVLRVLGDGHQRTVADVARDARMDVGAVSRQLRVLEGQGLVEREASPVHGSVVLVRTTDAGFSTAARVEVVQLRQFSEALANWTPEQCVALGRSMSRLVDDLQRTPYRGDAGSDA
jgi:DNA-binding MarR family transcriptional regulator